MTGSPLKRARRAATIRNTGDTPPPPGSGGGEPRARPRARVATTSAASSRRRYTPAERAAAVTALARVGLAEVSADLGIPAGTLSRWAAAAGVTLYDDLPARIAAAEAAALTRRALVERTDLAAADLLEETVLRLARFVATVAAHTDAAAVAAGAADPAAMRLVRGPLGEYVEVEDPAYQRAHLRALAVTQASPVSFRDAVAALDRAVVTLNLLRGDVTARGELVVRFGIPRPGSFDAGDVDALVVDVEPEDPGRDGRPAW